MHNPYRSLCYAKICTGRNANARSAAAQRVYLAKLNLILVQILKQVGCIYDPINYMDLI